MRHRRLAFFALVLSLAIASLSVALAQTVITSNATGTHDGYDYEFWKDEGGSGRMVLKSGGTFSCEWNNVNNILFRKGRKLGASQTHQQIGNITITYSAVYNPAGNSYLCVYGWTKNPLVEYYIVESWGNWRPPGASSMGTITVDGGTYDIYRTTRVNQPSIEGTSTFDQYWSVRTAKRTSGTISVSQHFNAWESRGLRMGNLYEVALCVEGYQSSGNADILTHVLTLGGGSQPPTPPPTQPPTQPPSGGLSVSVTESTWDGGATVNVTITNNGSSTVNGWTATWTFAGNERITSLWNGTYTQSGASVTVRNAAHNGTIQPGASVTFGFNISYTGSYSRPQITVQ